MHLLKSVIYKTVSVFRFSTCPFTIPLAFQTSEKRTTDYIFPGLIMLTQNTNITQFKKFLKCIVCNIKLDVGVILTE